ncbi:MAG: SAM-dependent methyltransferase, partial [Methylobacterium sp.]
MTAPPLFDTGLARRRLARAHRAGYADFLLRRVVDDLDDRLGAVLRTFT